MNVPFLMEKANKYLLFDNAEYRVHLCKNSWKLLQGKYLNFIDRYLTLYWYKMKGVC